MDSWYDLGPWACTMKPCDGRTNPGIMREHGLIHGWAQLSVAFHGSAGQSCMEIQVYGEGLVSLSFYQKLCMESRHLFRMLGLNLSSFSSTSFLV